MNTNLKLLLASVYGICLIALLFVVFHYLDLKDLSNFSFIKQKGEDLANLKNQNIFLFVLIFFAASILWVLFLGFGSPIAILSGFIFGKWLGTFICVISFTFGATLLYSLANFYFKEFIVKYLSKKIEKYEIFFKKNELFYFLIFRLTGGGGVPFAIQNILPVIFNMKLKNYFISTFLGLFPAIFIINSLGEGINKIIEKNENINYYNIISDPEIYLPIAGFIIIIIVSFFVKRKVFK
ncbi:MAG: TVP38/TMEM64 family protein [Pelagibacteraceae bacterium]